MTKNFSLSHSILKAIASIVALLSIAITANAQVSEVTIRFANPTFDCNTNIYCVDVEYTTNMLADTMYGTNVRFFYNEEVLTFNGFSDFAPDYGLTNDTEIITGVSSSGLTLFNFPSGDAATWVNAGVQLNNLNGGLAISNNAYTKYFSICFDVDGDPDQLTNFCPEIVWDLESDRSLGGFFSGSDGVVVTFKSGDSSVRTDENVNHLNWAYSGNGSSPYGDFSPSPSGCITDECSNCVVPNTHPTLRGN